MIKTIKFLCIILDEKLNLFKNESENLGLDPYKQGAGLSMADLSTQ
jgi:hypothetical protein